MNQKYCFISCSKYHASVVFMHALYDKDMQYNTLIGSRKHKEDIKNKKKDKIKISSKLRVAATCEALLMLN